MQDTSGVHVYLVQGKAFRALAARAAAELEPGAGRPGNSEFRVLGVLLHSVAVDRLEKKALVRRTNTDDRRVRLVGLAAKGWALIIKSFREHAGVMEEAAAVLSNAERLTLPRLPRKLGKGEVDE